MAGYFLRRKVINKADRELADGLMTIFQVLQEVTGAYYPTFDGASPKLKCPYSGLYHESTRSMRIYPQTNSAHCFSCGEYMTPLRLVTAFKGMSDEEAVSWIKTQAGYTDPDPEDRWDELMAEKAPRPKAEYLVAALKTACSRIEPRWKDLQFETEVSHRFTQCLSLLSKVRTESDGKVWLARSTDLMATVLATSSRVT